MQNKDIKIGFFGTPEYAVTTLEALKSAGFTVGFVVTMPDRPKGRGMKMTPPPAKVWADANGVPVLQPEMLKGNPTIVQELKAFACDVFVVIAYGKIITQEILDIPTHKSLNIHGSILPKLRGSSPIETAILQNIKETGVTIMKMDAEVDHGPILAIEKVTVDPWPPTADVLGKAIVEAGAKLLVKILPDWIGGKVPEQEQDHSQATFTKKIAKEDALIDLATDPYQNYLKIQAYSEWPQAYFFHEQNGKKIRLKIIRASYENGLLNIESIIPEGGKETDFTSYMSSHPRS